MINIKRGDTFAFYANIADELGEPLVTDIANLKSQIRDKKHALVEDLTISTTGTEGQYFFTATNTDGWLILGYDNRDLIMDIEMRLGGVTTSSETIEIKVTKDVTYE